MQGFSGRNLKEWEHTKHLGIGCKAIISGPTKNKQQVGTEFIWLRLGSNGGL